MTSTIARIYNQFDPAMPLEQGDPRYVSCENSRGSGNLVMQFNNAICWSERVVHLLFSGHRGGGKTTELLRLKNQLENQPDSQKPSFVVYFEADKEDIDVNDASFPDILLAIIRQVGREVRERLNEKLQPSAFKKLLQDVWNLLKSEVEFSSLDFDIGIGSLTATIKNSPDSRKEIRSVLEPKVSNLITAANEFLDEVNILLQKKGYKDLVVIVDNLDRIVLRVIDENTTTHDRLFIDRGPQLHALNCHIIYTLPISIVFTPKAAILSNIFGGQPVVLPMVKVEKPDMSIDIDGMKVMKAVIEKRLEKADAHISEVFDNVETAEYLCRMSGGHLRNLLILIRSAFVKTGLLPLSRDIVEQTIRGSSNDYERAIDTFEYFKVLKNIHETKTLTGSTMDKILLNNLSVLEYLNGQVWYSVNPVVRELEKFKNA